MDEQGTSSYSIYRVNGQGTNSRVDDVIREEPLEIWLKQYPQLELSRTDLLSTTMRTPGHDIELVAGWLFNSALVIPQDIASIEHTGVDYIKGNQGNRVLVTLRPGITFDAGKLRHLEYVNSSCGVCGQQSIEWLVDKLPPVDLTNRLSIPESMVFELVTKLNNKQKLFGLTGGCHGVALFDQAGEILDVKEDVGRHNAFDKLIGAQLKLLPGKYGVILSGRVSFEMVQKAAMAGISLIIAIGAPTSLAIDLCKERDIGLIGFVKSDGFNLYTEQRQLAGY